MAEELGCLRELKTLWYIGPEEENSNDGQEELIIVCRNCTNEQAGMKDDISNE